MFHCMILYQRVSKDGNSRVTKIYNRDSPAVFLRVVCPTVRFDQGRWLCFRPQRNSPYAIEHPFLFLLCNFLSEYLSMHFFSQTFNYE